MGNGSTLAGFLLLLGAVSASPTNAQTPSVAGAYERMSPGNQKVARALFDAQAAVFAPAPTSGPRAAKTLTLDEIAAQKQSAQGWGQVFQAMRSQGLVHGTSLGQIVTRYEHQRNRAVVTPDKEAARPAVARTAQEAANR
jgi:hypothetical protein